MAIDVRPVNVAPVNQFCPMPHIDSEVQDFASGKGFAVVDFCSGYWQLPVHTGSYSSCGIFFLNGVYSSTRVLPGLTNTTCYFHSMVEPFFHELHEHMKAWLDDFNVHAATEAHLLMCFDKFFIVCGERNLFFHRVSARCLHTRSSSALVLSAEKATAWIPRAPKHFHN